MKVLIEDLTLKCIIGLLKKERITPQKVIINATLHVEEEKMMVDYAKVVSFLKKEYKRKRYFTLEESLGDICKKLKAKYPHITQIKIKIIKPQILKKCGVGVELEKKY